MELQQFILIVLSSTKMMEKYIIAIYIFYIGIQLTNYGDKNCNAAEKVIEKLNKLEYYNVVHYTNGISEWSGQTEFVE